MRDFGFPAQVLAGMVLGILSPGAAMRACGARGQSRVDLFGHGQETSKYLRIFKIFQHFNVIYHFFKIHQVIQAVVCLKMYGADFNFFVYQTIMNH